MKWLMLFAATHGIQFNDDQCRVLRQVRLAAPECQSHFANPRNVAANYTGSPNAGSPAGSNPSGAAGPTGGGPAAAGGGPSHPGGPTGGTGAGSGGESPGSPASGSPGNPGGGDSRPGQPSPPLPTPPTKPTIDPATLAKLRGEIRDTLRQRAIERIVFGFKPPDRPDRPNFKPPDLPGRPSSKPSPSRPQGRQPGMGNP